LPALNSFSQLFLAKEKASDKVHDDIVDEHALLWFIAWSGDRPKLNRRGEYIPGTRVGAASITGCQFHFYLIF
jgi:hypothetical protein